MAMASRRSLKRQKKIKRRNKRRLFYRRLISLFVFLIIGFYLIKGINIGIDRIWGLRIDGKKPIKNRLEAREEMDTREIIEAMAVEDKRIEKILNNYSDYPDELLEMLSRNIDILDFTLAYPEKKGKVYADSIEEVDGSSIPFLLQYDERWGYGNYGDSIMAISGCAPTALSMVVSKLKEDKKITPYTVAQFAEENGYYISGTGTSWGLFTEGSKEFGLKAREVALSQNTIYKELEAGRPIIASMGPGDFTTTGHMLVLTGVRKGKIKIHDPNSKENSKKLWDYEKIEGQIKNLWAFESI